MGLPADRIEAMRAAARRQAAINVLRQFVFDCRCRLLDLERLEHRRMCAEFAEENGPVLVAELEAWMTS